MAGELMCLFNHNQGLPGKHKVTPKKHILAEILSKLIIEMMVSTRKVNRK